MGYSIDVNFYKKATSTTYTLYASCTITGLGAMSYLVDGLYNGAVNTYGITPPSTDYIFTSGYGHSSTWSTTPSSDTDASHAIQATDDGNSYVNFYYEGDYTIDVDFYKKDSDGNYQYFNGITLELANMAYTVDGLYQGAVNRGITPPSTDYIETRGYGHSGSWSVSPPNDTDSSHAIQAALGRNSYVAFYYDKDPAHKTYIYNGSSWVLATPYIYNGSSWVEATEYIYDGGWQ